MDWTQDNSIYTSTTIEAIFVARLKFLFCEPTGLFLLAKGGHWPERHRAASQMNSAWIDRPGTSPVPLSNGCYIVRPIGAFSR